MAITYVGGQPASSSSSATLAVTHGLTINANDVIVVAIHSNSTSASFSGDTGGFTFTKTFEESNPSSGTGVYAILVRVAGASEPTTYTFDTSAAADRIQLSLSVFQGVDTSTIWDVTPSASTRAFGDAGDVATSPALTTADNGNWGVAVFLRDSATNFLNYTNSYTNEVQSTGANRQQAVAMVSREFATSGSQGTVSADLSSTDDWVAHQFALLVGVTGTTIIVPTGPLR